MNSCNQYFIMKKIFYFLSFYFLLAAVYSCDYKSKPYLKHELKFEKLATECDKQDTKINIDANTIGERYTFQECLNSTYDGRYKVERNGDTVNVQLANSSGTQASFKITLDINTRSAYNFLTINGNTMPVTVTRY